MTETEIIALIKARSHDGYDMLYENYAADVYADIRKTIAEPNAAEDILHRVFVTIWKHIDDYNEAIGNLSGWIQAISSGFIADHIKNKESGMTAAGIGSDISKEKNNIDKPIAEQELDMTHHEVIVSLFMKGCSYEETAKQLDLSIDTVKTKMREALKILRDKG